MDPPNGREAVREVELRPGRGRGHGHGQAGPALPGRRPRGARRRIPTCRWRPTTSVASTRCSRPPAANGWLDERRAVLEALTSIARAGADMTITYYAKDVARWLGAECASQSRSREPSVVAHNSKLAPSTTRSDALFAEAQQPPPGRRRLARARLPRRRRHAALHRCAARARASVDVDGNRYVDYLASWGPLIAGHAHPGVVDRHSGGRRARHQLRRADSGRGRAGRTGARRPSRASTWCASSTRAPRPR